MNKLFHKNDINSVKNSGARCGIFVKIHKNPFQSISNPSISQLVPQSHQQYPKPILPTSIAPIPPILIPIRMLNELPFSGPEQLLPELWVLDKLVAEALVHDPLFYLLPVLADGVISGIS